MGSGAGLSADMLLDLFAEVDAELKEHGEPLSILIVGGAAIALQWGGRWTHDVDVVSEGMTLELRAAVARVGLRRGLRSDWINDAAKLKAASPEIGISPRPLYAGERFSVYGADARYLLAMKLMSMRPIDRADLPVLLEETGISSEQELFDLVEEAYPNHAIPVAVRYIITDALDQYLQDKNKKD